MTRLKEIRKPHFCITLFKLCLGVICYALSFHYTFVVSLMESEASSANLANLRLELLFTACVAFTFVIEPAIILAYLTTPQHFQKTYLNELFAFGGLISYISSGSLLMKATSPYFDSITKGVCCKGMLITSCLFLATGVVYFGHFVYLLITRCKSKTNN